MRTVFFKLPMRWRWVSVKLRYCKKIFGNKSQRGTKVKWIFYIYIYRQDSWNCFWYIMFSLILQCCISFLVTLLPAYLKGTVWLWILQKQMYKRSCTMSQMWRPRRLGTSTNWQTSRHPIFDVSALPGNIGSTLPLREERWKKWKDMWWTN